MKRAVQTLFLLAFIDSVFLKYIIVEDGRYDCAKENSGKSKESLKGWRPTPFEDIPTLASKCFSRDIIKFLNCFHRETYVVDEKGCFLVPRAILQDQVFKLNKTKV